MIKAAIWGGGTLEGGELIRLLAMHPEVEITDVEGQGLSGKSLTSHHHGLIGETTRNFSSSVDFDKCDVLFVCDETLGAEKVMALRSRRPDLKIILLSRQAGLDYEKGGFVYGLPEINRKQMVRGATAAVVPESMASMALVALFPFSRNLLLSGEIAISVTAPQSIIEETDMMQVKREIETMLHSVQLSYDGEITIELHPSEARRSALMDIEFRCELNHEAMIELYDIYDDHNFTFITTTRVGVSEVAGTNKCIVGVMRPEDGKARLMVAADCRLRGASGEAIHIMNLLFGLHEKTGLALKAIDYNRL
ncbi:MAG: hypothetical protein SO542_02805 [Muribaculaceae bacterium]|nr:hypothetical protein [Muribaculaceae bacterium]